MKRKLHYLPLIFALCLCTLCVEAQNLTEFDKEQIVRRATLKIDEFEGLLNLISDPTRSRGAVDQFILSSYSKEGTFFNQVFYNKDVMIEDDISPITLTMDNIEVSAIDVATYLNNFKQQYEKNRDKTVFFTDITFSEVMQEGYAYVVASYTSDFKGKNIYKNHQYQPVKRKATLRAEYNYQSDAWQVWIAGVNFDREEAKPLENVSMIDKEPVEETKQDTKQLPVAEDEKSGDTSVSLKQQEEKDAPPLQFTSDIPQSIKKGKSLALKWNHPVDDASISLYQGEQEVMTLQKGLNGQQWNWKVQQKPGKNYSIMLYDPQGNRRLASDPFRIKRKIPLGLYVGVGVAVVATAIYFLLPDDACENGDCPEELAKPPGLPTN